MDAYYLQGESTQTNTDHHQVHFTSKPIMIYYFLDPLCKECWLIDPYIKKLTIEYGEYFNLRPIISHLFNLGSSKMPHPTLDSTIDMWNKYYFSLGIKAATLQGNRAGRDFLRHIQQSIFFYYDHLQDSDKESIREMIHQAADRANLDLKEFYNDIFSDTVEKAYQSDIQLKREMNVNQYPTFVFYSQHIDDYGIKVSGIQCYETYTHILKEMLQFELNVRNKPTLKTTLQYFKRLQTKDIAFIYDCSYKEAERQLKQLQLMQIVKEIDVNGNQLWEYCG